MNASIKSELVEILKKNKSGELDENETISEIIESLNQTDKVVLVDTKTKKTLTVADIVPKETSLKLNNKEYTVGKYTPPVKWHFLNKYPDFSERLSGDKSEEMYAEIAYKLIKNKDENFSYDYFLNEIQDNKDIFNLIKAVQEAMGQADLQFMTELEYEEFCKEKKKEN